MSCAGFGAAFAPATGALWRFALGFSHIRTDSAHGPGSLVEDQAVEVGRFYQRGLRVTLDEPGGLGGVGPFEPVEAG
jgi:hypothetical protein